MRGRRIDVDRIKAMREAGLPLTVIAKLNKCSPSGVSHIVKQLGLSDQGFNWRGSYAGYRIPRVDPLLIRLNANHKIEELRYGP